MPFCEAYIVSIMVFIFFMVGKFKSSTVPKIIALRVGTPGATIDTLNFAVSGVGLTANTDSQQAAAGFIQHR